MNPLQAATTLIPYRSSGRGRYALLFIHGFMDAGAVWEPTISRLHADARKITIDLPSMGELHSYAGEVSLQRYAADVGALIEQIGKPVITVAQSMGAQIAELAAIAARARVRGATRSRRRTARGLPEDARAGALLQAGGVRLERRLRKSQRSGVRQGLRRGCRARGLGPLSPP
jgi:pimeloyl-ACP methyl ester carboxylesterase